MRPCCCLFAVFAVFVAGIVPVRGDEAVELRWGFRKGQVHKYRMKHHEVKTVNVADQKFETTTTTDLDWVWTVQDLDEQGTATLGLKLAALRVHAAGKDFEFDYDSSRAENTTDEEKKKFSQFFDQFRLASYTLRLKPDGRIVELSGLNKALDDTTPGGPVGTLADFHGLHLRDGSFAWLLQLALGVLPGGATAAGGRWEVPVRATLQGIGELDGATEMTLGKEVKVDGRACRELQLGGKHSLELDMKWAGVPANGTFKTSKLSGKVYFDRQAGALVRSKTEAVLSADVKLGFNADQPLLTMVSFTHTVELEAQP